MEKVQFPAVIIISRGPTAVHDDVFVCADDRTCRNDRELRQRLGELGAWARAYRTPYNHTPAPAGEVDAAKERIRAELAAAHGLASEGPAPNGADYLGEAYEAAKEFFAGEPDKLSRLDRALELARAGLVWDKGAFWWVRAASSGVWRIEDGRCNCPDASYRGQRWCKHALAVALVRKAAILENEAGSAHDTPAPSEAPEAETSTQNHDTTSPDLAQIKAISISWGGPGVDVEYMDGRRERRRDLSFPELEAQAKAAGWTPNGKQGRLDNPAYDWQGEQERRRAEWTRKLAARSSEQVAAQRDRALPAQHSRGRAKLYK